MYTPVFWLCKISKEIVNSSSGYITFGNEKLSQRNYFITAKTENREHKSIREMCVIVFRNPKTRVL